MEGPDELLSRIAARAATRPDAIGAYLHGSRSRGEQRPDSDVDVVVLVDGEAGAAVADALRAEAVALADRTGVDLDLKVIPIARFAPDPWVDLCRARHLGGRRWHQELPERSLDDAAHESLGVLRVLIADGAFASSDAGALAKSVGRLASVLAAVVAGVAPGSGREAVELLRGGRSGAAARVAGLVDGLAALPPGAPVPPELTAASADAVAAVLAELRRAHDAGELGPRCTEAAAGVLAVESP